MATELKKLHISTDEDILFAHELAMRFARKAGAQAKEQLWFAARVTEICRIGKVVIFSLHNKCGNRFLLKAVTDLFTDGVEQEVPRKIDNADVADIQESLQKSREELEHGYKTMQQFVFALSHDLKNSLAKLKLAVSLVEEEQMPPAVESYVQIIHRASSRLEYTMQSLNQIIKLGHHSPEVIRKISPISVFEDVKEEFSESLYGLNASVSADFSNVGEMKYIETYLRSIFSNIISNAIKYSHPDRQLVFSVKAYKKDGKVVFTFADNGQGIDLIEFGDKLFMPFTRVSENVEGSGIGLYLVKNMVQINGGSIEVQSEPGKGTVFTFYLQEY